MKIKIKIKLKAKMFIYADARVILFGRERVSKMTPKTLPVTKPICVQPALAA